MTVGLDFETWSDVNLVERGLANYVASPNFHVLLASVDGPDGIQTFDFVYNTNAKDQFLGYLNVHVGRDLETVIAHNAPFERAVLNWLKPGFDYRRVRDSAVEARALGAEGKLMLASRQLTDSDKLEEGPELVMLFCVPNAYYPNGPTPELIKANGHEEKWTKFIKYCEMDATGSKEIDRVFAETFKDFAPDLQQREQELEWPTYEMNLAGWHVDRALVEKMKQRGWVNGVIAQKLFVNDIGEHINFKSFAQLKKFCADRGVKYKSLDKYHLPIELEKVKIRIEKLDKIIGDENFPEMEKQRQMLREVQLLFETKAELGGSTLSKLPVILNLTGDDDILRDQYVHIGAGQTFRTTGRGVQMQNLKKLDGNIRDMDTLFDLSVEWSNGDMAGQLRQVFTSRHDEGHIVVGDFSAVESRGLAYIAGEEWKLNAYREGKDVYKVLVTKYLGVAYEDVTAELRPRGKYSELSCGYQASGKAVQEFMFRLGFDTTIEDALQNVSDWRMANPAIVDFWHALDICLKKAVRRAGVQEFTAGYGLTIRISPFYVDSIQKQHPGAVSLMIQVILPDGTAYVNRIIHGCYMVQTEQGSKLLYYKPVERLRADGRLWTDEYKHPKTKKMTKYSVYGGKLAGIIVQSLCREMFFDSLAQLRIMLSDVPNAQIVGQFHDEIAVDWQPGPVSKEEVERRMEVAMSTTVLDDFPLTADIKSAYRYIK